MASVTWSQHVACRFKRLWWGLLGPWKGTMFLFQRSSLQGLKSNTCVYTYIIRIVYIHTHTHIYTHVFIYIYVLYICVPLRHVWFPCLNSQWIWGFKLNGGALLGVLGAMQDQECIYLSQICSSVSVSTVCVYIYMLYVTVSLRCNQPSRLSCCFVINTHKLISFFHACPAWKRHIIYGTLRQVMSYWACRGNMSGRYKYIYIYTLYLHVVLDCAAVFAQSRFR